MKPFYEYSIPEGNIGIFWLGQAGFLIKSSSGKTIMIDPYFSNCCERFFGFKRLMPQVLTPTEVIPDLLLISHAHYDHLDIDSIEDLMNAGNTELWGACDVEKEVCGLNVPSDRITYMKKGTTLSNGWVNVTAVDCDHGELAPDALGFLIEFEGKRIYITGDTAFRPDIFQQEALANVDVLIIPINGAFGNVNEAEAAEAARMIDPGVTIPCHFWNFAEHGGNPFLFMKAMEAAGLEKKYTLLRFAGDPLVL